MDETRSLYSNGMTSFPLIFLVSLRSLSILSRNIFVLVIIPRLSPVLQYSPRSFSLASADVKLGKKRLKKKEISGKNNKNNDLSPALVFTRPLSRKFLVLYHF